ncbi:hypothetical protein E2C01_057855 [Portunus trituberculatus]|uniref:Uncharacterized protein n=1 Tax=Portunus trituberculatus TaxID=210409 RepID=A0A5B7GU32_PORTR|nr:hypothetical protein [Portunus trituberculatus]
MPAEDCLTAASSPVTSRRVSPSQRSVSCDVRSCLWEPMAPPYPAPGRRLCERSPFMIRAVRVPGSRHSTQTEQCAFNGRA